MTYSPSNGTVANVVLCDLDLHFQGKPFYSYAFVIKKIAREADVLDIICLDSHGPRRGVALVFFFVARSIEFDSVSVSAHSTVERNTDIGPQSTIILSEIIVDRLLEHVQA